MLAVAGVLYSVAENRSLLEGLYWSGITATTVGYGDTFPKTTFGRGVAIVLVMSSVLFFIPMVTASFASKLIVNRDAFTHEEQEDVKVALAEVLRRLEDRT